jgi:putative ABC transport system permease protein
MMKIALRMLLHRKARFAFTILGIGILFLLSAAQVGLLVGWFNTITAIVREAGVDVWVMAEQTPAFDYGTALPRNRIYQVRNVPGVAWAEGMYVDWSVWQRPDGRRVSVALVGLDRGSVGGPWSMQEGKVEDVHVPHSVIIDDLFLEALGIRAVGNEAELYGEKAVVRGISREIRTFTASPFVFTSMRTAVKYDKAYHADETTYVLVRCALGTSAGQLAQTIQAAVPAVEALTTWDFMWRSIAYWMLETDMGLTVILTAVLGILVSVVVTSQTLFTITQDHLSNYATLLALGFRRGQMLGGVVLQGLTLSGYGISLGSMAFLGLSRISARTPVPLETTPVVFTALVVLSVACCLLGAFLSIKTILRIDPIAVFRV